MKTPAPSSPSLPFVRPGRLACALLACLTLLPWRSPAWSAATFAVDSADRSAPAAAPAKRGGFAPGPATLAAPAADSRSPAASDALPADVSPAAPGSRTPAAGGPFQPPGLIAPRVLGLYPNEFVQGTSYSVSLAGENLNPTLKVDFGPGILVKGAPVLLYGGKLKVAIEVLPFAATGKRKLKLGAAFAPPGEQVAEFQVVQKPVVASAAKPTGEAVKLPATILDKIFKGQIILDTPPWRKQVASQMPPKGPDGKPLGQPTPVWQNLQPTLDDSLLFIWHEQNPGLAERYEIRFFKGDKLLARRSLPASTGSGWASIPHYRPDAALIGELFQQIGGKPAPAQKAMQPAQPHSPLLFGMQPAGMKTAEAAGQGSAQGGLDQALAQADIAWEVAGFRSYAKTGVVKSALADAPPEPVRLAAAGGFAPNKQQMDAGQAAYVSGKPELVELEVEISQRWPLHLPAAPTSLACPTAMSSGLKVHNIDATSQSGKLAGASGFTYERFEIQGTLNLGKSPYAAQVDKTQASTPNTQTTIPTGLGGSVTLGSPSQVMYTTWSFDNVFVDWGDGTQEALVAVMGGDAGDYERGDTVDLGKTMNKYRHAYAAPGQYIVRLFQLGEDDIQGGGQQVAAASVDLGGSFQANPVGLYNAALGAAGGGSQAKAAQAELEYGKAVAERAYMVFCQPLSIQRRTDPAANGPLKLVDIGVGGVATAAGAPKDGKTSAKVPAQASPGAMSKAKIQANPATPGAKSETKTAVKSAGSPGQPGGSAKGLEKFQDFNALAVLGGVPAYSVCDYQLTPYGQLRYTGQGEVRTRWYVDGVALPPDAPRPVGPSQARPDSMLKTPPATWGPPLASSVSLPAQSPVGLEKLGQHELRVEAEALVDSLYLFEAVGAALGGDGAAQAALAGAAKEGSLPKLGVLAPAKVPVKPGGPGGGGPGPVMSLLFNEPAPLKLAFAGNNTVPVATLSTDAPKAYELTTQKDPPRWAVSPSQPYVVLGHDPAQPCTFDFPVSDGKFKVVGLQSPGGKPKVTRSGDRFSGQGDLLVPIPGGGAQKAPVNFKNWQVAEDGITVLEGQFSISAPGLPELAMPAVKGHFTRLDGIAGKQVDAWLDASLANAALVEAASATQVPSWKGAKAALSPAGDWYADGLAMAEFLVYDSGFRIKPQTTVALDLSTKQGGAPGSECGGGGNAWRGVALGNSDLLFFNFDMPGAPPKAVVSDWGIDADGLCGKAASGPQSHDWMRGKIGWKGVAAKAWNGIFKATYDDLWVHAPWLDATLTGVGDPVLLAGKGQGQGGIMLNLKGQPKTLKHGPITLRVDNLAFSKTQLGGGNDPVALPAVSADTCFDFQGEAQVFAKDVCFTGLYFAFDGRAYFQGANSKTVSLSGKSGKIAQGTVSLKQVKVGTGGGNQRLGFDFLTDLKISQALPAVPVPVSYQVDEPATAQYTGSGPATGSFEVKFDSPLVKANIKPVYTGPQDGTSVASNPVLLALADLGYGSDAPFMVALGGGDGIVFKGEVDLTQFQSAIPLKGAFLLGYHGDIDFWATKFTASVPGGVVLVPGVLSLYEFGGGLGYHVTRDSLVGPGLDFVEFSADSQPVLNATALVGTVDSGFTFAARGDLNIKPGGSDAGVDMAYTAWLLSNSHGGTGPINGTLGYGGGAFYGTMGGQWGPPGLDDYIYVKANPKAIGFSVGGDDWYFRAGTQDNPITGHVLILDQGAWLDLSKSGGFHVGAKANKRFPNISCDGGTCAYVEGSILIDAGLQLKPMRFDASGSYPVAAKGCLAGACLGVSQAVSAHAAAPNPYVLGFGYSLNGCPVGKLSVSLQVLPTVDPGVSAGLCSFEEIGNSIVSGAEDAWDAVSGAAQDAYDTVTSCFGLC